MQTAIVIKGRLVGPRSVELDEAASRAEGEVEVIVRTSIAEGSLESVGDFLRRIPAGTQSREEIDRQIREERAAWGDLG